jgi:hypothetical protein
MAGFNPTPELNIIAAEGSGFLGSGQSADVNPGFSSDKPADFWASYLFNIAGTFSNTFERAQDFALAQLSTLLDPRIAYFFKPVRNLSAYPPNTFRGVAYGLPPQGANSEDRLSDIGGADAPGGTPKGLGKAFNMRSWILTSVESMFLQAEAVQRGWIAGNAQTAYENAVRESFRWLLVPNADAAAAAYLLNNAGNAKADWAAASNKITLIMWQKYIGLIGIEPLETWSDWRRLKAFNIPLSQAPGTTATSQPIRLLYPQAEYDYNTENVVAQGTINAFTTKIFWMP